MVKKEIMLMRGRTTIVKMVFVTKAIRTRMKEEVMVVMMALVDVKALEMIEVGSQRAVLTMKIAKRASFKIILIHSMVVLRYVKEMMSIALKQKEKEVEEKPVETKNAILISRTVMNLKGAITLMKMYEEVAESVLNFLSMI